MRVEHGAGGGAPSAALIPGLEEGVGGAEASGGSSKKAVQKCGS